MNSSSCFLLHLLLYLIQNNKVVSSTNKNNNINPKATSSKTFISQKATTKKKKQILLLDVDNTLYNDNILAIPIEKQIISNIFKFCNESKLNLTPKECDELYYKYGTTVDGLRFYDNNDGNGNILESFYKNVYEDINIQSLYNTNTKNINSNNNEDGYNFNNPEEHDDKKTESNNNNNDILYKILNKLSSNKNIDLYITSNSPKYHILRILSILGLRGINWEGIITPDSKSINSFNNDNKIQYPTKSYYTNYYYNSIIEKYDKQDNTKDYEILLIDDSTKNIKMLNELNLGIDGIHINNNAKNNPSSSSLVNKVLNDVYQKQFTSFPPQNNNDCNIDYNFNEIEYLKSKNIVDELSINIDIWNKFQDEVLSLMKDDNSNNNTFVIADLGAGILSFFKLFFHGSSNDNTNDRLKAINIPNNKDITYIAYESNKNLLTSCHAFLISKGFTMINDNTKQEERVYKGIIQNNKITFHLRNYDFQTISAPTSSSKQEQTPDVIVGCCFADLFTNSRKLIFNILSHFNYNYKKDLLLYLPITYTGNTFINPSYVQSDEIPSDTTIVQTYNKILSDKFKHTLDINKIINGVTNYGGELLQQDKSNWVIDYDKNRYLWYTIFHFIVTSGTFESLSGDDCNNMIVNNWIRRCINNKSTIIASNNDLLFKFNSITNELDYSIDNDSQISNDDDDGNDNDNKVNQKKKGENTYKEIQFISPRKVQIVEKKFEQELGPNDIEIQSLYSLISSGTELKVFQGNFEAAKQLDVNIKSLKDTSMNYPLTYGYSLVGKIVNCGSNLNSNGLIGKLVFSFSPHCSKFITNIDNVHIIPDKYSNNISPKDAIFMPSMETAISITHDANIRLGENVVIYGQGLIGLLITMILQKVQIIGHRLTVYDMNIERLMIATSLGVSEALLPSSQPSEQLYDVAIEVSGNPKALQSAIDSTKDNGGRIIIASWYGQSDINLKLGIEFHRSHKSIITSQVSTIPATLCGLWDKKRRFDLTWEIISMLRPFDKLCTKIYNLDDAQLAYEHLESGKEIAIAFKYDH